VSPHLANGTYKKSSLTTIIEHFLSFSSPIYEVQVSLHTKVQVLFLFLTSFPCSCLHNLSRCDNHFDRLPPRVSSLPHWHRSTQRLQTGTKLRKFLSLLLMYILHLLQSLLHWLTNTFIRWLTHNWFSGYRFTLECLVNTVQSYI